MFEKIKALAKQLGFCDFAACNLSECKINAGTKIQIDENAQSVMMFVYPYNFVEADSIKMASYAYMRDYHKLLNEKLATIVTLFEAIYPNESFECYCDVSPIDEKSAAAHMGLGAIGKNNLLITKKNGTFILLGEIISSLKLDKIYYSHSENECENCMVCVAACPNNALENGFDKHKCLSYITQKSGELSADEKALIKKTGYIWGCDICARCCPKNALVKSEVKDLPIDISQIDKLTNKQYKEKYGDFAFSYKPKAVISRNIKAFFDK